MAVLTLRYGGNGRLSCAAQRCSSGITEQSEAMTRLELGHREFCWPGFPTYLRLHQTKLVAQAARKVGKCVLRRSWAHVIDQSATKLLIASRNAFFCGLKQTACCQYPKGHVGSVIENAQSYIGRAATGY